MPATLDPRQPPALPVAPTADCLVAITGTPFGRWQPLADAVASTPGIGLAGGDGPEAASPPGNLGKGRHLLVFVDGPAHAVARWVQDHDGGDASQALRAWIEASQRFLRHAHAHPSTCMLVDTAEAAANPSALGELLADRLGVRCEGLAAAIGLPAVDPVAFGLGAGLARQSRQAQEMHAQLRASCLPLSGDETDSLAPEPVDFEAAFRCWQGLAREEAELRVRWAAEAAAAAEAAHARQVLQQRLSETTARLEAAQVESDDVLTQLHASQEALEAQLLARQAPHPAAELAQRRAEELEALRATLQGEVRVLAERTAALEHARQEAAQWQETVERRQREAALAREQLLAAQAQLDARAGEVDGLARALREAGETSETLRRDRDQAVEEAADLRRAVSQLESRLEAMQLAAQSSAVLLAERSDALERARRGADRLQMELHAVQEELEHHFLALQALDKAAPGLGGGRAALDVAELWFTEASHAPPHHHLQAELRQLHTPYIALDRLDVRVVEHEGRPGLVILAPDSGGASALAAWHPTGQEDGRELMTLVPADASSQQALQWMATGDWRFVIELVALLHGRLSDESAHPEAARWRVVAARLQRQLAQLPARLRYSQVCVAAGDGDHRRPRLSVRFSDVVFGLEPREDLLLSWQPGASHGPADHDAPLQLLNGGDLAVPPLAGWPHDANGRPAACVALPVGPGLPAAEKRRRWGALSAGDRELVLALLDALPASARAQAAGDTPGLPDRDSLEAAARDLHRDAQQSLRQSRWRRVLRSSLRRLRGT